MTPSAAQLVHGASHCSGLDYYDGDGLLLLRYPLLGLGTVCRIHWQALRLWPKRVTLFSKPPAPAHRSTMQQETAR